MRVFSIQSVLAGCLLAALAMPVAANPVGSSLRPVARSAAPVNGAGQVSTKNAAFQQWVAAFKSRAKAQGFNAAVVDRAFQGVRYNPEVIEKDRNQSEFKREIWDYLDFAVSPKRVDNGKAALRQHARLLRQIEAKYGVDKEVVAAVWGMETTYGTRRGTFNVIEAMATLSFDGRRGAFFHKQLVAALKILQNGDVAPRNMTGSWAGAMGHTQFIPTSYQAYAVDFTGDGKRDIWSDNPADALASTAAYLKRHGWTKGQPWGVEVRLPRGFSASQASRKIKRMPSDWAAQGVVGINGRAVPNYGSASILLPAGTGGVALMIFDNFRVISRYNNAEAYVIGVGHLSDRLKGGAPFAGTWPRGYDPLSFDDRMEMQRRLKRKGYPLEKIDGVIGPNTVNSIKAFQSSIGVNPDGYPSQQLLQQLKSR